MLYPAILVDLHLTWFELWKYRRCGHVMGPHPNLNIYLCTVAPIDPDDTAGLNPIPLYQVTLCTKTTCLGFANTGSLPSVDDKVHNESRSVLQLYGNIIETSLFLAERDITPFIKHARVADSLSPNVGWLLCLSQCKNRQYAYAEDNCEGKFHTHLP